MGNAHSHTYADRQRNLWIRNSPQQQSKSDILRRTRSPTDDFMPEYGFTRSTHCGKTPRTAPTSPRSTLNSSSASLPEAAGAGISNTKRGLRIEIPGSIPCLPARTVSDGHIHFVGQPIRGSHDHSLERPPTPYPGCRDRPCSVLSSFR